MNNETLQIIQTVALAFITAFFGWLSKDVVPMIKNKIDAQQNDKIVQAEQMALGFARNIVVPLAVNATLGDAEKRQLAAQKLSDKLKEVGVDLPESTLLAINERAYQAYKASGGDVHKISEALGLADDTTVKTASAVAPAQPAQNVATPVNNGASVTITDANATHAGVQSVQTAPVNPYANQTQGDVK